MNLVIGKLIHILFPAPVLHALCGFFLFTYSSAMAVTWNGDVDRMQDQPSYPPATKGSVITSKTLDQEISKPKVVIRPRVSRHKLFQPSTADDVSVDQTGQLPERVWYRTADNQRSLPQLGDNMSVGRPELITATQSLKRNIAIGRPPDVASLLHNLKGISSLDTTVPVWSREYYNEIPSGDFLYGFVTDDSGNSYVTGASNRYSDDILTAKYSAAGTLVWARYYDGPDGGLDSEEDIAIDQYRNVFVAGWGWNAVTAANDVVLIKYDANGNEQWVARYHGPRYSGAHSVQVDASGSIYVAGGSQSATDGYSEFLLLKYNAAGSLLWERRIGQAGVWIEGYDINIASTGNVIVGGYRSSMINEMLLVACSPQGNVLWTSTTPGVLNTVNLDHQGRILMTGYSNGLADCLTIADDASGQELWRDQYDGYGFNDYGYDLCIDGYDNVYVAGGSFLTLNQMDCLTIKYNGAGVRQWVARENGPDTASNYGRSIVVDREGRVSVLGNKRRQTTDLLLIQYDSTGSRLRSTTYDGSGMSDDEAFKIISDAGGNLRFAGTSYGNATYFDYILVKVNPDAAEEWRASYSGHGIYAEPLAVAVDTDRNVYVTGDVIDETTTHRCLLLKYDAAGNLVWIRRVNGNPGDYSYGRSIAVSRTGDVFVAGEIYHPSSQNDFLILKYDPDGNELWSREVEYAAIDVAHKVAIDDSDNVIVTGASRIPPGDPFCVTMKFTGTGEFQWLRDYTTINLTRGFDILIDRSGNYTVLMLSGNYDLVKYTPTGDILWDFVYGGAGYGANAKDGTIDHDGNIYITGVTRGPDGNLTFCTVKVTSDGVLAWDRRYIGVGNPYGAEGDAIVIDTTRRSLYVTGYSPFPENDFSAVTIKYDLEGNERWIVRHPDPTSGASLGAFAAVDSAGNLFVVGDGFNSSTGWDYLVLKYDTAGIPRMENWLGRKVNIPEHSRGIAVAGGDLYVAGLAGTAVYSRALDVIKFSGGIVLPLMSPRTVQFDTMDIGCSSALSLTVKNLGNTRLDVLDVSSTMKGVAITPRAANITPGNEQEFRVSCTPEITGAYNGNIVFIYGGNLPRDSAAFSGYCRKTDLTMILPLRHGWNIVSSPLRTRCPISWGTTLFTYDPLEGYYVDSDTLSDVSGAWLKSEQTSVIVYGYQKSLDTIQVYTGWNLIGSISEPVAVSSLMAFPLPMETSPVWGYEASYFATDTIYPGRGYWIKVDHDGNLVLSSTSPEGDRMQMKLGVISEMPPPPPDEHISVVQDIPKKYVLEQAYPNPFNPNTNIRYEIPKGSLVVLKVYNILGQEIKTLVDEYQEAGYKEVDFDATALPSGLYFYRFQAGKYTDIKKMLLMR